MDALTLGTAFKMVTSLGIVLLTFGGAVMAAKKLSARGGLFTKKGAKSSARPLEILSFQNLGPGKNVYLLRCLDKKILVGVTNAQISHLTTMDEEIGSADAFQDTLQDKLPAQTEKRLKEHFDASLKDVSRV